MSRRSNSPHGGSIMDCRVVLTFTSLLLLAVILGATEARSREVDEFKRVFESYVRQQQREQERRDIEKYLPDKMVEAFDCKNISEGCRAIPSCCGTLQCYWANGFSILRDGVCVTCIREGQTCQRSRQCCEPLICDKEGALSINGVCGKKRTSGKCYKDKQCVNDCQKKWYQYKGRCV